jgi:iron complex outermembrane recepter protein
VGKRGYRFAERDQTVRSTSYGWGSIAPEWSGGNLYLDHVPEQSDYYSQVDWSDFHGGGVLDIEGGNSLYFINRDVVANLRSNPDCAATSYRESPGGNFNPYSCREGVDSKYGIFLPNEITNTVETNNAAYVRVDFGSDDTQYRFSGNVGLRYMELERESTGFIKSAELDKNLTAVDAIPAGLPSVLTGDAVMAYANQKITAGEYVDYADFYTKNKWSSTEWNYLSEADRRYGTKGADWSTATDTYDAFLPSLNLKVELTDDLISRFAVSKAIALPDMSLVRNNISIGTNGYDLKQKEITFDSHNPDGSVIIDPVTGEAEKTLLRHTDSVAINDWTGSSGNTYIKPMESTPYDVSLEWYFSKAGSLTGTVFYKDLSNFFVQGASRQAIAHPVNTKCAWWMWLLLATAAMAPCRG